MALAYHPENSLLCRFIHKNTITVALYLGSIAIESRSNGFLDA